LDLHLALQKQRGKNNENMLYGAGSWKTHTTGKSNPQAVGGFCLEGKVLRFLQRGRELDLRMEKPL